MDAKTYLILGRDERDAEALRDEWLLENSAFRVLRVHHPKDEPRSLLMLIGGRDIPRVSITIEYE